MREEWRAEEEREGEGERGRDRRTEAEKGAPPPPLLDVVVAIDNDRSFPHMLSKNAVSVPRNIRWQRELIDLLLLARSQIGRLLEQGAGLRKRIWGNSLFFSMASLEEREKRVFRSLSPLR